MKKKSVNGFSHNSGEAGMKQKKSRYLLEKAAIKERQILVNTSAYTGEAYPLSCPPAELIRSASEANI